VTREYGGAGVGGGGGETGELREFLATLHSYPEGE
jgi:hypothetical protein